MPSASSVRPSFSSSVAGGTGSAASVAPRPAVGPTATPTFSALPSTFCARASAGMPRGIPSSTLVRCGFSSGFSSSQNETTSSAVCAVALAEDVRMPRHHLRGHVRRDVLDVEVLAGGVGGDVGVEEHLVEHVAELLDHLVAVARLDRVDELPALLDEVLQEALVRLVGVPGAAAGRAQQRDGRDELVERGSSIDRRRPVACSAWFRMSPTVAPSDGGPTSTCPPRHA